MTQTIHTEYRQCKRCVMDTSDAEISFDATGHCCHCTEFLDKKIKLTYQGAESDKYLSLLVKKMKAAGKKSKYDCVAGISGGADSCYAAIVCKQLGLRVLLVHLDNGWNSETSVKNIEVVTQALGLDYTSYVLDWNEFKDIQLAHLKASTPEIETPTDIAILQYLHKAAAENNVKHIVMGGNYFTEGILPKSWHYNAKDKAYSMAVQKEYGTIKPKNFPAFDFWQEVYYKFIKGIRIVYLLNHVPYTKKLAVSTLQELGWKDYGHKHHESFYTRVVQSYILPVKFNIDYRKPTLSNKICTGQISREEALKILERKPFEEAQLENDIAYTCKKLGISIEEFNNMMAMPPKTYHDYPNNAKRLERMYGFYRKLFN